MISLMDSAFSSVYEMPVTIFFLMLTYSTNTLFFFLPFFLDECMLSVQLWLDEQKYVFLSISDDKSLKTFMEQILNRQFHNAHSALVDWNAQVDLHVKWMQTWTR